MMGSSCDNFQTGAKLKDYDKTILTQDKLFDKTNNFKSNEEYNSKFIIKNIKLEFPIDDKSNTIDINDNENIVSKAITSTSSSLSSCSSVETVVATKKKRKKKYCQKCDLYFHRTHKLLYHLKSHVTLPTIELQKLDENNSNLHEYFQRQKNKYTPFTGENFTESESLKFKSRALEVIRPESPLLTNVFNPIDAMTALSEMQFSPTLKKSIDNKHFECPPLDGLGQYAEEINKEGADDLLKKLLKNDQHIPQENCWASNTNEFISIDRLAHMCTVCHCNFPDGLRLYEHKQITGHEYMNSIHPSSYNKYNNHRKFTQPTSKYHQFKDPPNSTNMKACISNKLTVNNLEMDANKYRLPPPLYRVPGGIETLNRKEYVDANSHINSPMRNYGNNLNPKSNQLHTPNVAHQTIFPKIRSQQMPPQTNSNPYFSSPLYSDEPLVKKSKIMRRNDFETVAAQSRLAGLPIIQSVQGGAIQQLSDSEKSKNTIQLNDQVVFSKEVNKNPKEVANILAHRGITVTHKPKLQISPENSSKDNTLDLVQRLQLNNSVSIISKKKSLENTKSRIVDSMFISCPIKNCEKKFLTQESLNRHKRGHRVKSLNIQPLKCHICSLMFPTKESLINHQQQNHRSSPSSTDEMGIPIIDLKNERTKEKLAALGIVNYIPLNIVTTNGCYAFPVISVQDASIPNGCNILGMGVNSVLSLGPMKKIPK